MRVEKIGNATLYLGDCREVLQSHGQIDSVVTDPPYGMGFQSNYRTVQHKVIANDRSEDLLKWACEIPCTYSKYVFCRWDNIASVPKARSLIVWVKNNWSMGDLEHEHARQTEAVLFWNGPEHFFPSGRPSDVISYPRTNNNHHPTEKPVGLMRWFVRNTYGTVYDPFMGSGSTGAACAQEGRSFVGCEIDPNYFDFACKRIEDAYLQRDLFVNAPKVVARETIDMFGGLL